MHLLPLTVPLLVPLAVASPATPEPPPGEFDPTFTEAEAAEIYDEQGPPDVFLVACDPAYHDWDLDQPGLYVCYGLTNPLDTDLTIANAAFVYRTTDPLWPHIDEIPLDSPVGVDASDDDNTTDTTEAAIVIDTDVAVEVTEAPFTKDDSGAQSWTALCEAAYDSGLGNAGQPGASPREEWIGGCASECAATPEYCEALFATLPRDQ